MLKARVITALLLIAGLLSVLFLLPPSLAALAFIPVVALGAWEWGGLLKAGPTPRRVYAAVAAFGCLLAWLTAKLSFPLLWGLAAGFWLCIVPLWLWRGWPVLRLGYLIGLVVLLPAWAGLAALLERGPALLLAVMAAVWVADVAAYAAGRAFGRHKLAPAISPGKTWEGVAGALAGVLLYGLLVAGLLPALREVAVFPLAGFLLLLVALSVVGDLFESLAKRQAGLKDSGQLLPGHGGVLDRIDSLTATLPLVALGLHWTG